MFEWHGWAVVVASPGAEDDEDANNHPTTTPHDVLTHIGLLAPGSYGVLHSIYHGVDNDRSRRVLRRGSVQVEVEVEETLSPHVGKVEDPDPNAE